MRRRLSLLALLLPCACDPGWAASGSVSTMAPESGVRTELEGAHITVLCPSGPPFTTRSDAAGEFVISELGFLDDACEVVVRHPGFESERFEVDEICTHRWRVRERRCHSLEVAALLHPASTRQP